MAVLELTDILKLVPHRYPMLLIDRIEELEPEKRIVAIKNVTFNEPHFMGHFPDQPVMPGVLIIEALAQASAVMVASGLNDAGNKLVYFMTIDNARFRKPVTPGDQLRLEVVPIQNRRNVWKCQGIAWCGEQKMAEAQFSAMIVDKEDAPAA